VLKLPSVRTWAVIKSGGKQYKVAEGETLIVDRLQKSGKSLDIEFKEILLVKNDQGLKIGQPFVEKAKVRATILEDFKDKKIRVVKFKSKSRYLRTTGHRQSKTKLLVDKIES